jgi:hypothetical protein
MRYKKIEYTKCIGCHHDDNGELTGGTPIEMVAMYDSHFLSEQEAQQLIKADEENKYLMIVLKCHYDNILLPAVKETTQKQRRD